MWVKPECVSLTPSGEFTHRHAVAFDPTNRVPERSPLNVFLHVGRGRELSASEVLEQLKGGAIGDARQDQRRWEEGQKSLSGGSPPAPRLAEVLETRQRQDALTPAF